MHWYYNMLFYTCLFAYCTLQQCQSSSENKYEGHPIKKLQNSIIQLIFFKIWKMRNIGFVRNSIGHIYWNFYEDDVIIVTSRVHRTQSVSAVLCPFFHHLPSVYTIASYEYQKNECIKQWNLFKCQNISVLLHCSDHMRDATTANAASLVKTTNRPGLFSSTRFSHPQANFFHQTCIAGLVKHLSTYTHSEWYWAKFFCAQKMNNKTLLFKTRCFQQ